jgi:hypothetical protein
MSHLERMGARTVICAAVLVIAALLFRDALDRALDCCV